MSGSVTVLKNSTVTYTIEKEGYTTVTNTVVVSEDTSTTVTMDLALVTLTIEPDPSDATVTLTAAGYTQSGNSISVAPGTTVNYSVSKDGYTTVTGSEVCTINRTINCTLEYTGGILTINITRLFGSVRPFTVTDNNNNVLHQHEAGSEESVSISFDRNTVTTIYLTNLSYNPTMTGSGVLDYTITGCSATGTNAAGDYWDTLTLTDLSQEQTLTLEFSSGPT